MELLFLIHAFIDLLGNLTFSINDISVEKTSFRFSMEKLTPNGSELIGKIAEIEKMVKKT